MRLQLGKIEVGPRPGFEGGPPAVEQVEPEVEERGRHRLVVDDEANIRALIDEILSEEGQPEAALGQLPKPSRSKGPAPRNDLERRLASLWQEVLGVDEFVARVAEEVRTRALAP